jgi:phytoene synthase
VTQKAKLVYPAADMDSEDAIAHVTDIVRRSGSSFYWAMRLLPRAKREAMYAVYAVCREVDDIADDPGEQREKLARLADWRVEVERLYAGHPHTPTARALIGPVADFDLPKRVFLAIIEGMEIDAADRVRMPTISALEAYCDRVACAVGRLSNRIFGVDDPHGEPVAVALGQALQLTNILRDLEEDAAIDRLYVPADMLAAHGIPAAAPELVLRHPRFPHVCDELAAIAARRFEEAERALDACNGRRVRPARLMMQNYRRVFEKLCARGWSRPGEPVSLGTAQKLWILFRYGLI